MKAPSSDSGATTAAGTPLADVIDQLTARLQAGEEVNSADIAADYPEYAEQLSGLLPALRAVAVLGSSGETTGEVMPPNAELGDYRIVREVGRGGMGIVYEAEQLSLRRRVALKVLPFAATMDPKQLQRFRNEALAAASLHHEHIVPVFAVGCERGVHYYAMQFVEGLTLAQIIGERGRVSASSLETPELGALTRPRSPETALIAALSTKRDKTYFRAIASLIADAADALEYAHSMGVVHRDVKPGNLMLDAAGRLWVTDFGLARFGRDAGLTLSGDLLGTLRYMAPEQALAKHGLADHRVDVYGLGATLYELLTGQPAVRGSDMEEILRNIASQEPIGPRRLDKSIPAELETITLKALAKNPAERYASAGELAADLQRWLADKPIKAKAPGVRERVAKWTRRHKALTAVYGLLGLILVLAASGGVAAWQWQRADLARGQAETAFEGEQLARGKAEAAFAGEKQARSGEANALRRAETVTALHRVNMAHRAWTDGDFDQARVLLDRCPTELRNWEWQYVNNHCREPLLVLPNKRRGSAIVGNVVYSADGRRLAGVIPKHDEERPFPIVVKSSTVWVFDLTTKREVLLSFPATLNQCVTFSPDGKWIAASGTVRDDRPSRRPRGGSAEPPMLPASGIIKLWNAITGEEVRSLTVATRSLHWVRFSPDSKRLVGAIPGESIDTAIKVWDVPSLQEVLTLKWQKLVHNPRGVAFSADGRTLTTAHMSPDGDRLIHANAHLSEVKTWDLATGQESRSFTLRNELGGGVLAISPGGNLLAQAHGLDTIRIWDLIQKKPTLTVIGPTAGGPRLTFSPDGTRLAGGLSDQTVRVWDLADGREVRRFRGHLGAIEDVAFSPDGNSVASIAVDGSVRVWDLTAPTAVRTLQGPEGLTLGAWDNNLRHMAYEPVDKRDAAIGWAIWDLATNREVLKSSEKRSGLDIATSPFAKLVAVWWDEKVGDKWKYTIEVWDLATGKPTCSMKTPHETQCFVAFHPDGRHLVSAAFDTDQSIRIWDITTGKQVGEFQDRMEWAEGLAISPDGKYVARYSFVDEKTGLRVKVWDWSTRQFIQTFGRDLAHSDLVFAPSGHLLAAAEGKAIKVWDVETGREVVTLTGHATAVSQLAFSPDGTRLASASRLDGSLKLWDWAIAEEALSLKPRGPVSVKTSRPSDFSGTGLAFSSDGRQILYLAKKEITVWETTPESDQPRPTAPNLHDARRQKTPEGLNRIDGQAMPKFGFGWAFNFGFNFNANGARSKGNAVAVDSSGDVYVSGMYTGKVDFDPNSTNPVAKNVLNSSGYYANNFVAKYLSDGTFQWVTDLGDNGNGSPGVAVTVQGGAVFAGYPTAIAGGTAASVARLNAATGAVAWVTPLNAPGCSRVSVAVGPTGGVYVTGDLVAAAAPAPARQSHVFVSRLDANGKLTWTSTSSENGTCRVGGLTVDAAGSAYAIGTYTGTVAFGTKALTSRSNSSDAFIWRLNVDGGTTWAGSMGSDGTDMGQSIALDAAGNVFVTGMWGNRIGAARSGDPVTAIENNFNPNNGPAVQLTNFGGNDCFVAKLAPDADERLKLTWARNIGGLGDDRGLAIAIDGAGNVYTTGSYTGTANFNPSEGQMQKLTASGSQAIFVSKLTPSGDYADAVRFSSSGISFGRGITVDGAGNVYSIGCFVGTVNFSPTGVHNLTAIGSQDTFILKLTQGSAQSP